MISLLIGVLGLVFAYHVARSPQRLWSLLVFTTIVFGPIVYDTISYFDEYLVGCIVLGFLLAPVWGPLRRTGVVRKTADKAHKWVFVVMVIYMTLESARGMIITESVQKVRWIVYFLLLAAVMVAISRFRARGLSPPKMCLSIVKAGFFYFLCYLGVGITYAAWTGLTRSNIQNVYWGGTTYASFPMVVVMPAAIFIARDKGKGGVRIAWLTIILMIISSFYYDSRASWLALLAMSLVALPIMGVRRILVFAGMFFVVLVLFMELGKMSYNNMDEFIQDLKDPFVVAFEKGEGVHDIGRLTHLRIALPTITTDARMFLFGCGLRASGPLIGPKLYEYLWQEGQYGLAEKAFTYESSVGLTTILIETGVCGMALLVLTFVFTGLRLLRMKGGGMRPVLLTALGLNFLWLWITNPFDIVLFYLLIMPGGLFVRVCEEIEGKGSILMRKEEGRNA